LRIDTDGDGTVDTLGKAFTGGRAVWELFASEQSGASRAIYDIAVDPFVWGTLFTSPLAASGRRLARTGLEQRLRGEAGSGTARILAGAAMQQPHRALTALDRPLDEVISRAGRLFGPTDDAIR